MKQDSWLYSDSFLKRAFSIWGHYFVANLIIGAAVVIVVLLLALIFGIAFAPRMNDAPVIQMEEQAEATM